MTQALYAHMNNKTIKKTLRLHLSSGDKEEQIHPKASRRK
jgi:hypothetical protein